MSLSSFSVEDLEAELLKRKAEEFTPLATMDFQPVIDLAKTFVEEIVEDREDDDNPQWAYESVMKAVYGADIFDRLSKYQK